MYLTWNLLKYKKSFSSKKKVQVRVQWYIFDTVCVYILRSDQLSNLTFIVFLIIGIIVV